MRIPTSADSALYKRGNDFVLFVRFLLNGNCMEKNWLPMRHEAVELDVSGKDRHYVFDYQWKLATSLLRI